jgi:hypothetical protein
VIGGVIENAISDNVLLSLRHAVNSVPDSRFGAEAARWDWRGRPFDDPHQPIGILVGQRLQQHGVDHAEHRRRGADAEPRVITAAAVKPGLRISPRTA